MKKLKNQGTWDGRDWNVWSGSIHELLEELPNFTMTDLRIGKGVNKYKCIIVRDPLKISLGDVVNDDEYLPIPIEAVRKQYVGKKWENFSRKTALLGYGLVQHQDLLNSVLEKLKEFSDQNKGSFGISNIRPLTNTASILATLETTTYGARMHIEFIVPEFRYIVNDVHYTLKVICRNSVDKRIAVSVTFFLCHLQDKEIPDISFKVFYSTHEHEELKDNAIERNVYQKLDYIGKGKWITETVELKALKEAIKSAVTKRVITQKNADEILDYLKHEAEFVKMLDFILMFTQLQVTAHKPYYQEKQRVKIFKLIDEVRKEVKNTSVA